MNEKQRILIVEDEQALAKALQLKLEESGYSTVLAFDGKEALESLAKADFDLIILDILMPTIDGWSVLAAQKDKGRKILVLSNLGQEEDIQRARTLGAQDYLIKANVSLSQVVKRVAELLKGRLDATTL